MGALATSTRVLGFASRRASDVSLPVPVAKVSPVTVREPRKFPDASTLPTLPVNLSDDLVEFYAFVFCQGGFRQLGMTFEQFLLVATAIKPPEPESGLESTVCWGEVQ